MPMSDQPTYEYRVSGVDRATGDDRMLSIRAWSRQNAQIKAELQGLIVSEVKDVLEQVANAGSQAATDPAKSATSMRDAVQVGVQVTPAPNGEVPDLPTGWEAFDPEQDPESTQGILEGRVAGQIRGRRMYRLEAGRLNLDSTATVADAVGNTVPIPNGHCGTLLLACVLSGSLPGVWQGPTGYCPGWSHSTDDLWLRYDHPLRTQELHPHPIRWNWLAFLGGGLWALWTRTWHCLWFSVANTAAWAWNGHLVQQAGSSWNEDESLLIYVSYACIVLTRLLYAPFANRIRHAHLLARGYTVCDYVRGRTRDEARANLANGLSAEKAHASLRETFGSFGLNAPMERMETQRGPAD